MGTDFEHGIAVGMLFGSKKGGETVNQFNGNLRAVIDSSGNITIVIGEIPEDEETEIHTDFKYRYSAFVYTKEIKSKTTTVSGDGTVTTIETVQTFSQLIITELYDANGKLLMRTDCDIETGKIYGFYDGDDVPIYTTEWRV